MSGKHMCFSLLSSTQNRLTALDSLTILCKHVLSQCYLQHVQVLVKVASSKYSNISKLFMFFPIWRFFTANSWKKTLKSIYYFAILCGVMWMGWKLTGQSEGSETNRNFCSKPKPHHLETGERERNIWVYRWLQGNYEPPMSLVVKEVNWSLGVSGKIPLMKIGNIHAAVETWMGTACNTDWKRWNQAEMYTEGTLMVRQHSLEAECNTSWFNQFSKTKVERRVWLLSACSRKGWL